MKTLGFFLIGILCAVPMLLFLWCLLIWALLETVGSVLARFGIVIVEELKNEYNHTP